MNNTRAERDDPAVHQASSSRAEREALCYIQYYIMLSLLKPSRTGPISVTSDPEHWRLVCSGAFVLSLGFPFYLRDLKWQILNLEAAWQNSRQRAFLFKCGSYLKGGLKEHAGHKAVSDGANSSLMIARLVVTTAPGCSWCVCVWVCGGGGSSCCCLWWWACRGL